MSKLKIMFGLGVWVAVLPFLGFPYSLKNTLFTITGVVIIFVSYLIYNNLKIGDSKKKTFENFSENSNFEENEEIQ